MTNCGSDNNAAIERMLEEYEAMRVASHLSADDFNEARKGFVDARKALLTALAGADAPTPPGVSVEELEKVMAIRNTEKINMDSAFDRGWKVAVDAIDHDINALIARAGSRNHNEVCGYCCKAVGTVGPVVLCDDCWSGAKDIPRAYVESLRQLCFSKNTERKDIIERLDTLLAHDGGGERACICDTDPVNAQLEKIQAVRCTKCKRQWRMPGSSSVKQEPPAPGPVVEIERSPVGGCHPRCHFAMNTCPFSIVEVKTGRHSPGHLCPGPAPAGKEYRLTLHDKQEPEEAPDERD